MLLLFYEYVEDMATRREPFRDEHLALVRELHGQGLLKMAGAFTDPLDGAALVFATDDRAVVEEFVARDPYVKNGLVPAWRVRAWNVVVGG